MKEIDCERSSVGIQHDQDKLRWDLVPMDALEEVVRVFTVGCEKYEDENWRKGISWKRMFGSIMRHAKAWMIGEDIDEETGCHHLACVACRCLMLLWYVKHQSQFDDRYRN